MKSVQAPSMLEHQPQAIHMYSEHVCIVDEVLRYQFMSRPDL